MASIPESFPSSADAAPAACLNCGTSLAGPYCHACRQAADDIRKPVRRVVAELSSDAFALDTRFFRTVGPLLFRPGFLTVEYLIGRREPYAPPLRVYVFASVVFFGLVALLGDPIVRIRVNDADPVAEQKAAAMANATMTYVHFFLVPVFAAILMLVFRRPKKYYVEHLVFAFHYGAFAFLLFMVFGLAARALGASPAGPQPPIVDAMSAVWFLILFGYLVLALKRVYGGSWAGTTLRAAAVGALYLVAFGLVSAGLIALSFLVYLRGQPVPFLPRGLQ